MELIKINPTNEKYFSDDFIKGFKCGAQRQFEADKKERPKEGEWITECDGEGECDNLYRCSECGCKYGCQEYDIPNFCPNCGADMRERRGFQVIVNGNCTKCGKPLSGNRIFICEECEEQARRVLMSDLIDRKDAINVLEGLSACEEYGVEVGTDEETYIGKYEAITAISDLPSADRPQGKWIYCEDDEGQDGYRCSECGFFVPWYYDYEDSNYILDYKACPHCLARMKGADDE